MKIRLTEISNNKKVGRIPVTTTERASCPDSCALKKICYAQSGKVRMVWEEVETGINTRWQTEFENDWLVIMKKIARFPTGQLWRHNQAGDLPNRGADNETIDPVKLGQLVKANRKKNGWTYTHKPDTAENIALISFANENGFTINLSANDPAHADSLARHGLPIAVVVGDKPIKKTAGGLPVAMCPAQDKKKNITCAVCKLCANPNRRAVVGFLKD
jgi:hypothetical protein